MSRQRLDTVCICQVDNKKYEYDYCTVNKTQSAWYEYIGKGIIHSVDGVEQNSQTEYHFWKKPAKTSLAEIEGLIRKIYEDGGNCDAILPIAQGRGLMIRATGIVHGIPPCAIPHQATNIAMKYCTSRGGKHSEMRGYGESVRIVIAR